MAAFGELVDHLVIEGNTLASPAKSLSVFLAASST